MVGNVISSAKSIARPFVRQRTRQLKSGSKAIRRRLQPLTASIRLLPDFIIIGAQKSGTTSLYQYLGQHPYVAPSLEKEVHFFDANFGQGLNWYRAHFASIFYKYYVNNLRGHELITGEASPYYVFYPHAPRRIFETLPQVKLIVLLRNPVDRAYSHYFHQVRRGRETLTFEEALKAEPERLSGEVERILADEHYLSYNHVHFSYLARGIYVDQLEAWFKFFPREQMLILSSEDFFAQPSTTYRQVLEFLGLPAWKLPEYRRRNVGHYRDRIDPATRKYLVQFFAPHNQRLFDLLGVRFAWNS